MTNDKWKIKNGTSSSLLSSASARLLNTQKPAVPKLAVHRPLNEGNPNHDLRAHPVRANSRQPYSFGERRLGYLKAIKSRAKLEQHLRVETGAYLSGEDKIGAFKIADQQSSQTDARSLRIRKTADHELLRRLTLHLEPVLRTPVLIYRVASLRDDALPRFRIYERLHVAQRRA